MHPGSVCGKSAETWAFQLEPFSHEQNAKDEHGRLSTKALSKRQDAPLPVTPVQAVARSIQQRGERHIERMAGVSERGVDHIETMDGPEILNSVDQIEKLDKVARRTFGLNDIPAGGHFTLNNLRIDSLSVDIQDKP